MGLYGYILESLKILVYTIVQESEVKNMIIGDPFKFAVLFERIEEWHTGSYDNGVFVICINGKLFPYRNLIVETTISYDIKSICNWLKNIPSNEQLYAMDDTKKLYRTLHDLVYPLDDHTDYRYMPSDIYILSDNDCFIFAVKGEKKIKILAANLEYNCKESIHIFEGAEITEVILEENEVNEIIKELEKYEGQNSYKDTEELKQD